MGEAFLASAGWICFHSGRRTIHTSNNALDASVTVKWGAWITGPVARQVPAGPRLVVRTMSTKRASHWPGQLPVPNHAQRAARVERVIMLKWIVTDILVL